MSIDGICFASNRIKRSVTTLFYSSTCDFSAIIFKFDIKWICFSTIYINFFSIFIRVRNLYCWCNIRTCRIYNYSNFNLVWLFTLAINSFILNCVSAWGICINGLGCCVTIYWNNFSMDLITQRCLSIIFFICHCHQRSKIQLSTLLNSFSVSFNCWCNSWSLVFYWAWLPASHTWEATFHYVWDSCYFCTCNLVSHGKDDRILELTVLNWFDSCCFWFLRCPCRWDIVTFDWDLRSLSCSICITQVGNSCIVRNLKSNLFLSCHNCILVSSQAWRFNSSHTDRYWYCTAATFFSVNCLAYLYCLTWFDSFTSTLVVVKSCWKLTCSPVTTTVNSDVTDVLLLTIDIKFDSCPWNPCPWKSAWSRRHCLNRNVDRSVRQVWSHSWCINLTNQVLVVLTWDSIPVIPW